MTKKTKKQRPTILWDWGTAYDLFASLHVLHHPDKFGLRGAWAAGVRSRLTAPQRTILEDAQDLFFSSPLVWVSNLPEPKDAATALWTLSKITPADRLSALAFHKDESPEILETLKQVTNKASWNDDDLGRLQFQYEQAGKSPHSNKWVTTLNWWSHAEEFGERYLAALQAYVAVFFDEEEKRIKPYLQQALADAQAMATQLDFSNLFIELSQGVMIAALEKADEVKFVPSYWITPLVLYDCIIKEQWVVLFGARPAHVALVPG